MVENRPSFTPYAQKTSVIQIHSYQNKNPQGTLENPFYGQEKHFSNLTQLLLLMEQLQDQLQYPQKSMEPRRFKAETAMPEQENSPEHSKPMATFKVQILFRQNASWQGNVTWTERGLDSPFRSALELIGLMDSVLS